MTGNDTDPLDLDVLLEEFGELDKGDDPANRRDRRNSLRRNRLYEEPNNKQGGQLSLGASSRTQGTLASGIPAFVTPSTAPGDDTPMPDADIDDPRGKKSPKKRDPPKRPKTNNTRKSLRVSGEHRSPATRQSTVDPANAAQAARPQSPQKLTVTFDTLKFRQGQSYVGIEQLNEEVQYSLQQWCEVFRGKADFPRWSAGH